MSNQVQLVDQFGIPIPTPISFNISQIGGVATQMSSSSAVALANVPESGIAVYDGTSLLNIVRSAFGDALNRQAY